jgi:hypothetical protein
LKNENKIDFQCLSILNSIDTKKKGIKLLIDQNLLTEGIKKYLSKFS